MNMMPYHSNLSPQGAQALAEELDRLLADVQVYHQNVRKLFWSKQLRPFFKLHEGLGELDHMAKAGEEVLANQILTLGASPTVSSGEYLMKSRISPVEQAKKYDDAVKTVIQNSRELMVTVKEVFDKAVELDEQHTVQLMGQIARQLSINIWYFSHLRMAQFN